jgi:hypothetical protein
MASELRVDRIIPVNGVPTGGGGGIVQVVNHKTTTRFNASIAHSDSTGITATSGSEYTTFNFTPLRSDSKLLLTSSTFLVGEGSNHSDAIAVFATYGGDTIIGSVLNYSGHTHWDGNKDTTFVSFNHMFDSWGTTQKAISIRVAPSGTGTITVNYPNGVATYASQFNSPNIHEVTFTMMEVSG